MINKSQPPLSFVITTLLLCCFSFSSAQRASNTTPIVKILSKNIKSKVDTALSTQEASISRSHEFDRPLGYSEPPYDWSYLIDQAATKSTPWYRGIASSYDLRSLGYVTSVKDQGACGSCWAFTTFGSLESNILLNTSTTWDFSEQNLKNTHGFDNDHCLDGGNTTMSFAYLSRWSGPINESDDPYDTTDNTSPSGLTVQKIVTSLYKFASESDIKSGLSTYGALFTTMHWDDAAFNSSNDTYYYSGSNPSNHAVTLVGWDDNKATDASSNGAWLIKNSWGTSFGDNGYFWISYADAKAVKLAEAFCDAVPTNSYRTIYYYDTLGNTNSLGYNMETGWGANIFTATASESLQSVGFFALYANTAYEIYIYDTFSGGSFSTLLGSTSGTATFAGYHTIDLSTPIPLSNGDDFGVVVKFTAPSGNLYPIPVEAPIGGYSSGAQASAGQSYISSNGSSFSDITTSQANYNVCIRALTIETTNQAPVLGSIGDTAINENTPLSMAISASDANSGDNISLTTSTLPTGASFTDNSDGTGLFSWTPTYTQSGAYPITFTVSDNGTPALIDTERVIITVNDVNRAPILSAIGSQSANESETVSFTVSATDPDGHTITLSAANLPSGATFTPATGLFSWSTDYDDAGVYSNISFTATDNGSPNHEDTETITITISNVNRAPILASIGDIVFDEGQILTFTVAATDPDDDDISLSATAIPDSATFDPNTGDFRWATNFNDAGAYPNITFTATDNGTPNLIDSETITITVNNINQAPILATIGDISMEENQIVTFTIVANDPDGDAITLAANNLPDDATFDSNTGDFRWATDFNDAGIYPNVTFTATDNGTPNQQDSEIITFTVANTLYTIAVSSQVGGTTSPSGNQTIDPAQGTTLAINASANVGHHFSAWTVSGGVSISSGDSTGRFGISGDGSITATFDPDTHTISFVAGSNGLVNNQSQVEQKVLYGANSISVTAAPETGYQFLHWTLNGIEYSNNNPLVVTSVSSDLTLTANFIVQSFTITLDATAGGTITPAGPLTTPYGQDSPQITITPNQQYKIVDVLVDGVSQGAISTYTFVSVTDNHTLSAQFDLATNISHHNTAKPKISVMAHPNPAMPDDQRINFYISATAKTTIDLTIFDAVGNTIFSQREIFVQNSSKASKQFASWNIRNRNGRKVSGHFMAIIFCRDNRGLTRYRLPLGVKSP